MIRIHKGLYSPQLLNNNPEQYFVFGDNTQGYGRGGQACIRGLPNAIGLPTKVSPGMDPDDFFDDAHCGDWYDVAMQPAFKRICTLLDSNNLIAVPADGLGTGLALLPQKAPKLYNLMMVTFYFIVEEVGLQNKQETLDTIFYKDMLNAYEQLR